MTVNRRVLLAARPAGIPQASDFRLAEEPLPRPAEGEVLVRNRVLSVDPAMRGWVSAAANYAEPVALGAVMRSLAVGEVIESRNPDYAAGEILCGFFGWQDYAAVPPDAIWFRHDPALAPIETALGVLGINGLTAWFGLTEAGQPRAGDTVLVSTAAGGVGSAVGQIARSLGCRTVGITSTPEKMTLCRDVYGYDASLSYRGESIAERLAAACPEGANVYFDNAGGAVSDVVAPMLADNARWVVCGTASIASWDPWPDGPRIERHVLVKRIRMQGILVFDWRLRFEEGRAALAGLIAEGKLTWREEVLDGIEQAPGAIARLYGGENRGKLLIRL